MADTQPAEERKCQTCSKAESEKPSTTLRACARCKDTFYCSKDCQAKNWDAHKSNCKRPNYMLKFHLCPDEISDPEVTRTLSVPATATFAALHEALQISFGWANTHAYDFAWHDPDYEEPDFDIADYIRSTMEPKKRDSPRQFVMRISEKEVPGMFMMKVDKMHEERLRKHPRTKEKVAENTKLFQVLDDAEYTDKSMEYMYDFGDGWQHTITIEGRAKPSDHIVCIDGSGHGVAEDVKRDGWAELKEAYRTQNPNREQKEKRRWFERQASNADPRGLGSGREHEWSKDSVNQRLAARGL
ncbi:hypothetical protein K469DRAFT_672320 [Zopfia rhizophila CBS 207.26]|uniref:MYND-type domain-containing protein n=1 Tax=Zopfia rhizophila CBS 207.26 TaxID=1314779 RepID=A0A6A6DRC1_9PEZI|nr:hypothetical protein K469DRAFT_672320 [Zopfia rhizophila CBS 207.26]